MTKAFIALFVRRPILALTVNAFLLIAGLAALQQIEIRELPSVERPIITIATAYAGAAPETIDQEITAPIEAAAAGLDGLISVASRSRFGSSRVTLEFDSRLDLNVALADVRDVLDRLQNDLPDDADTPTVIKADADAQPILRLALTARAQTPEQLTQVAERQVLDRLRAIEGVADVQVFGARAQIFRVDLDFRQMTARGLDLTQIRRALQSAALDVPTGTLDTEGKSLTVRANAPIGDAGALAALPLGDGIQLSDVATVLLGPGDTTTFLQANGQVGIGLGLLKQAGANTLAISRAVHVEVARLAPLLPGDTRLFVTSEDARFINGSIEEVLKTLAIAILIVVLVIFLFLWSVRATLIPALTMPIALIATLAGLYLAGFSINILTLLALVLATGMVVDDAIVVLENIMRLRGQGLGPKAAAVAATRQVFFAVLTTTLTLAAVFIPLSFLPGQAGGLFREFGFTLAIAVGLSSLIALTLCPMLASVLLDDADAAQGKAQTVGLGTWIGSWVGRFGRAFTVGYVWTLKQSLANPLVVVTAVALVCFSAVGVYEGLRQELTPREDRAVALLSLSAPQGVSTDYTARKVKEVEAILDPLVAAGEVQNVFSIVGLGTGNRAFMVFTLAPWGNRSRSQDAIVGDINRGLFGIVGIRAFAMQPNSLGIRGGGRGQSFAITGDDYDQILGRAEAVAAALEANLAFGRVNVEFEATQPQLSLVIDRDRAADLGVDLAALGPILRARLSSQDVGTLFVGDQTYDIELLSTQNPINDPSDLENATVLTSAGQAVPLSSFVRVEIGAVASELTRQNQRRAIEVTAGLTPALPLGAALAEARALALPLLAAENQFFATGEAAELEKTNATLVSLIAITVLLIFLVLAAQFESFSAALVVMLTVPLGVACAIFALGFSGISLNIYSQVGLILLIGIMAKNGILIVEFANQLRDTGASVYEAILDSARLRLRPVLMTLFSTVLGGLPLVLASGAGAEARASLGWVIVGGLGLATLATLYLTPLAYYGLARFAKPRAHQDERLQAELDHAAQMGEDRGPKVRPHLKASS